MSAIKLNLVDAHTILAGTIHGSTGDACIAALTAEPETIAELEAALARYIRPDEHSSQFASFRTQSEIDCSPHDAGLLIIDLAARIVAAESTYSQPEPEGVVHYHNGKHKTDIPIRYLLGPEWLFVNSVDSYRWSSERRRSDRQAKSRIDTRAVLFGRPLLEFIVDFQTGLCTRGFTLPPITEAAADAVAGEIVKAHAAWLTTQRDDLGGRAPRDVMLEKRHLIDMDMDSRSFQWSIQGEGPPCLPHNSYGYRYAGFGTHEWVVYYELVRHLFYMATTGSIEEACAITGTRIRTGSGSDWVQTLANDSSDAPHGISPAPSAWIDTLERLKTSWLESPQPDYDDRTPAVIIDNERRRLPITMTPEQLMIDEDCECCQMLARDAAMGEPTFWHLDGCNMEDEYAFSTCLTIEEWEARKRRQEEFDLEFARRNAGRRDWDHSHLDSVGDLRADSWQPLELDSHEMAELIEQMKRRQRRRFNPSPEDEQTHEKFERKEPVN